MNPLDLIPAPYRIAALAIAVLLICVALYAFGRSDGAASVQAKWDAATVAQQKAAHSAELISRAKEQSLMNQLAEAQNAATIRETKLRADYDSARRASLGLRDTIAGLRSGLPTESAGACRATADAALAVFGECSAQLGEMAAAADGHASDVKTLSEAWPR